MRTLLSTLVAVSLTSIASAQIVTPYTQDFESLDQMDTMALANDGWLVFGGVYDNTQAWQYGYGAFPAPMGTGAFSDIDVMQGGPAQGAQQLSVYSDYLNAGVHGSPGWLVESNTFREWVVDASDVGKTFRFTFDVKRGDLDLANVTAHAFIKTIDNVTFNLSGAEIVATAGQPTTWSTVSIEMGPLDASQIGHFFQIGFLCTAGNYDPSGMFYDNLLLEDITITTPLGTNYCMVNPTSTGNPSIMGASGSASILANDLVISCDNIPGSEPGVFFYGLNQGQFPFGEGFRCVTGTIFRLWPPAQSSGGTLTRAIDYNNLPTPILAGTTWNFQGWFLDPTGGPSGGRSCR